MINATVRHIKISGNKSYLQWTDIRYLLKPVALAVYLSFFSLSAYAEGINGANFIESSLIGVSEPFDDGEEVGDIIDDEADVDEPEPASEKSSRYLSNRSIVDDPVYHVPLKAISPETLKTFVQVIDLVRRQYVEPVNDEELFNDAISGMLHKLDIHAEFLDAEAYENLRAFTAGDIGHVGIHAKYDSSVGQWVVTSVDRNSPAATAGMAVGDYLHQINSFKLNSEMQTLDIEQMLSGIAGSQVDVIFSQAGRARRMVTLQRNLAEKQHVSIEVQDSIAIIRLPVFQNNTAQQIFSELQQLNVPITGVLLDIRNNPGGVLESAIDVASLFMEDTVVVQVQGREGEPEKLVTRGAPILTDLPVVILQNRYSASAAEVLASSLQSNNRATVVGERSYGKGSVQSVLPLNDEQAIKLTVAYYLTADGEKIDGIGVTPDIELSDNSSLWKTQAVTILLAKDRNLGLRFNEPEGGLPMQDDY